MDDEQVKLLQPLLENIKDSGTQHLSVEQQVGDSTYKVDITRTVPPMTKAE